MPIRTKRFIAVALGTVVIAAVVVLPNVVLGDKCGQPESTCGDINGDGYDDLVTIFSKDDPADTGTLSVLPGTWYGFSKRPMGGNIHLPFEGYDAVVGDINGDGKDDVVIDTGFTDGPEEYKLRTYPGSADGLDSAHSVDWNGEKLDETPSALTDTNGDGYADLVVGDRTVAYGSKNWFRPS